MVEKWLRNEVGRCASRKGGGVVRRASTRYGEMSETERASFRTLK